MKRFYRNADIEASVRKLAGLELPLHPISLTKTEKDTEGTSSSGTPAHAPPKSDTPR